MEKTLSMTAKNKAFWEKPKEQQRVQVAKDVIKQLNKGFINAESGTYCDLVDVGQEIAAPRKKVDDLFKFLKRRGASCDACGIGACFVSLVNLGNNAETKSLFGRSIYNYTGVNVSHMRSLLRKVFPSEQLTLIECAFEKQTSHEDRKPVAVEDRWDAVGFGSRYATDEKRLIAIMKNIIENNGTFKP